MQLIFLEMYFKSFTIEYRSTVPIPSSEEE